MNDGKSPASPERGFPILLCTAIFIGVLLLEAPTIKIKLTMKQMLCCITGSTYFLCFLTKFILRCWNVNLLHLILTLSFAI
jgi:hypothetical protein